MDVRRIYSDATLLAYAFSGTESTDKRNGRKDAPSH